MICTLASDCTIFVSVGTSEAPLEENWQAECEKEGLFTLISWNSSLVENAVNTGLLISGTTQLNTSKLNIEQETIQATEDDLLSLINIGHQRRSLSVGNKRLLVVRVSTLDYTPSEPSGKISDSVFGTEGDLVNAKYQFEACSFDQIDFTPFQDEYTVNGVREITIPFNASGESKMVLQNAVTAALGDTSDYSDYVMYCMPPGTKGNWIAYAYINGRLSVYNDKWCSYVSAQMHEIGHNLGLGHANEAGTEYGDQSGYMGYSYGKKDWPKMCFNSHHSWLLGWYNTKVKDLALLESFSGELSPFIDYNSTDSIYVMIRVADYFIHYNKKAGFNSDTIEGADQVLVFQSQSLTSNLVAKLGAGQSYSFPDLSYNKTIKVHAISETAHLSILDLQPPQTLAPSTAAPTTCQPSKMMMRMTPPKKERA